MAERECGIVGCRYPVTFEIWAGIDVNYCCTQHIGAVMGCSILDAPWSVLTVEPEYAGGGLLADLIGGNDER